MKLLLLMLTLVGLIFLNCSHDTVVGDTESIFDDATGPPLKVSIASGGTMTNPSTTISIGIPEPGDLTFTIHNSVGKKIVTLADGPIEAGQFEISWDAKNESGEQIKRGIYIYRLSYVGSSEVVIQYSPVYAYL